MRKPAIPWSLFLLRHPVWAFIGLPIILTFIMMAGLTSLSDTAITPVLYLVLPTIILGAVFTTFLQRLMPRSEPHQSQAYELDQVISNFTRKVRGDFDTDSLARLFINLLPEELDIAWAALWLHQEVGEAIVRNPSGKIVVLELPRFRLAACRGLANEDLPLRLEPDRDWLSKDIVIFDHPRQIGPVHWRIFVPLCSVIDLEGVLLLGPKRRDQPYTQKDIRVLTTLASWLGAYLGGVRLLREHAEREREQNLELARQEHKSRRQMAGELHDQVLPLFMYMRSLITTQKYDQLDSVLEDAIQVVRGVMQSLTPDGLEGGLERALIEMQLRYATMDDPVEIEITHIDDMTAKLLQGSIGHDLCLIIYEAVNNAKKSGPKVPVKVLVEGTDDGLQVFITDKGPGFDITEPGKRRYGRGLWNMQARAERMGAQWDIRSQKGLGTVIGIKVPLGVMREHFGEEMLSTRSDEIDAILVT